MTHASDLDELPNKLRGLEPGEPPAYLIKAHTAKGRVAF